VKNGLIISLFTLGLAACGGESDSETPTITTEFSSGIKGADTEPALTDAEIAEGDIVSLNTNLVGNVLEGSSVRFSFTLEETKKVALLLSSGVFDLDLSLSGNNESLSSTNDGSTEVVVFDAEAGESYSVTISSQDGAGEFQLKFVEANRSSLGLASNDYLVSLESTDTTACIEYGVEQEDYTEIDSSLGVINWAEGYVGGGIAYSSTSFSSVDGNTFTMNASYSSSEDGYSGSSQGTLTLTTDFTTGVITGSARGSYQYSGPQEDASCTYTAVVSGQVIL
jgi:hypothetical protein